MYRVGFVLGILMTFSVTLSSQILGLSSAKVNAFTAAPLPTHWAELEPSFGTNITSSSWNSDGDLIDLAEDQSEIGSGMCIRSAYALTEKLEVACMVPTTVDLANFSMKYFLGGDEKNGFAVMTGIKVPMGNRIINKDQRTLDEAMAFGVGTLYSRAFSESVSLDFNIQYFDYLHSTIENHKSDLYLFADFGNYIGDTQYLLINSVGYAFQNFETDNTYVLSWYPGLSIEVNSNLNFALNLQLDLIGKNAPKTFGFGFGLAFTLIIPKPQ